jgi:hypothetical protein
MGIAVYWGKKIIKKYLGVISIVTPTRRTISQFYFGTTLHVSDSLSVHHQESKTVHTASGICHTGSAADF